MIRSYALYVAVASITGIGTAVGLRIARDYPWLLAGFSGLGLGALVLVTLFTVDRLHRQVQEDRERRLRR